MSEQIDKNEQVNINSGFKLSAFAIPFFVAMHFVFDIGEEAFNLYSPFTEIIGLHVFFGKLVPPFFNSELIWIFFVLFTLVSQISRIGNPETLKPAKFAISSLCLLLIFFILPAIYGIFSGGDLSILIIQLRGVFSIAFYFIVGLLAIKSTTDFTRIYIAIFIANVLKSLQGLYVYFVVQNGSMNRQEYLLEHYSSEYFMTALIFVVLYLKLKKRSFPIKTGLIAGALLILTAFVLNDRRTSVLALFVSLAIVFFSEILRPRVSFLKTHFLKICAVGAAFGVGIIFSAALPSPLNAIYNKLQELSFQGRDSFGYHDYRVIENFNLFENIKNFNLFGVGYGLPIPFKFVEYDFSFYPYFNTIPHNSFLAVWALGGILAFSALSTIMAFLASIFVRIHHSVNPEIQIFGALGLFQLTRWSVFSIGDIGLSDIRSIMLIGILSGGLIRIGFKYDDQNLNRKGF